MNFNNISLNENDKSLVTSCSIENCKICNMENLLDPSWLLHIKDASFNQYFSNIQRSLHSEKNECFPSLGLVFNALNHCPLENLKVVIIGQDPYHNPKQAMGLAFSVPKGIRVPPSLKNIYEELKNDIDGFSVPNHGDLTNWARQGVLLLNDVLTVVKNQPTSHANIGWKLFTTKVLKIINQNTSGVVFMLWGAHAKQKSEFIDRKRHLVLEAGHPSPFSAKRFFGCQHFSIANKYLRDNSKSTIDWGDL